MQQYWISIKRILNVCCAETTGMIECLANMSRQPWLHSSPTSLCCFFLFSWCHSQSFWQHWNWNTYAYEYVCNQFSPGAISMLLLLLTATMKSILFIRYVFHLSRNTPTGCSKILFDTHHENIPYIYFAYHNNNNNRMASKFCPSHHITHKYHWYIASVNGSTESNIISCKMEDDVLHYILHPFHITQIK